jgi:hypothetical protein
MSKLWPLSTAKIDRRLLPERKKEEKNWWCRLKNFFMGTRDPGMTPIMEGQFVLFFDRHPIKPVFAVASGAPFQFFSSSSSCKFFLLTN